MAQVPDGYVSTWNDLERPYLGSPLTQVSLRVTQVTLRDPVLHGGDLFVPVLHRVRKSGFDQELLLWRRGPA